jgi:hypothetical protein
MGVGMAASGSGLSLSITLLMLERVLIIVRSSTYNRHHSKFVMLTIFVCGGVSSFELINTLVKELPLMLDSISKSLEFKGGDEFLDLGGLFYGSGHIL